MFLWVLSVGIKKGLNIGYMNSDSVYMCIVTFI